jgi:hypothetical protein
VTDYRREIAELLRPRLRPPGFNDAEFRKAFFGLLTAAGVPEDPEPARAPAPACARLDVPTLQLRLGVEPDGAFGPASRAALFARLSNRSAPAITEEEFAAVAAEFGVPVKLIKAFRKVEAPRGPYDDQGRPSILYERHVANRNTDPPGRYASRFPALFGPPFGRGGYGSFGVQYERLAEACAIDPEAAFRACSWGAFQVLGENAVALGYASAFDMALALTVSEAAHLDSFARFVKANGLVDELRACRAGDPESCIPFVQRYNGPGFRQFSYHVKLAEAAR